ncbi:type II toxin-antitoxin system PemK/MazF family toxin [Streptomyces caelestis]|uniref:Type II toxin-antitoxin system PemK/MazF family toxin n=1 Tax=Streptomyces heliomycini TaxID=284032 RepID=A0ABV5LJD0_9ACTN
MRRGDVHPVDLEPAGGSGADKVRPAVIVSDDGADESVERNGRGVISVVPLTSNTTRIPSFRVLLRADGSRPPKDSEARCERVRAVAPERLRQRVGAPPRQRMTDIDVAPRRRMAL